MKRMLATLAVAAITVTAFGGIAHAGGGSGGAAAACQHGGWRSLHRSDGTAFENQGDCVAYAAHGASFEAPCLDGVDSFPDARLTGPIDTFQNGTGYSTQDGTCTGTILDPLETIVSDPDAPTATAHCLTLDASADLVQRFNVWWPAAPADWWLCLRPAAEAPCLDGVDSFPDARLTGPIDTFQNGTGYSTQDGTCTGTILDPLETIVSDPDAPTATAHCLTLDASADLVQRFNVWWPAAPADWWLCLRPA